MDIGAAVAALKRGERVTRDGWNGRNMWLSLTPSRVVRTEQFWSPRNQEYAKTQGDECAIVREYVTMKTVNGEIVPWVCSQTDLLADDWEIV